MEKLFLSSKEDAEKVLEALQEIIVQHGVATVSDYHDLVGIPNRYFDTRMGWMLLTHVDIILDGPKGWYLDLPGPGHISMRVPEPSTFQTVFQYENGDWIPPRVNGGSAGINSAMFFVCPICGACILDMDFEKLNRIRHNEWHNRQEIKS